MSQTCPTGSTRRGGKAVCHFTPRPPQVKTLRWTAGCHSMGRASYKTPSQAFQLNIPHGGRDAALAAEPDPSSRDHPQHSPPSHATPPAVVNPGQHEKAQQGEGSGNRQEKQQQVQADDMPCLLQWRKRAARSRRQQHWQQHRGKQYFNRGNELGQQEREKDLTEQDPCASSSNGCGRQGGQRRSPVHGTQREQPGEACWQGHDWRRDQQQQQRTEPLHQDQAVGQSGSSQEERLFWNVKKHCWVMNLHMLAATLREASVCLRPMNMAGYCLPGMCTPHNTSQYIMDQHEYTWRNEEEVAASMSRGSSNYSTAAEDFPLMVPFPSMAREAMKAHLRNRKRKRSHSLPAKTRSAKMISTVKPKAE